MPCGSISDSSSDVFGESTDVTSVVSCQCSLEAVVSDEDVNLDVDKVNVVGLINDSAEVGSPDGRPIDVAVDVPWSGARYSVNFTGNLGYTGMPLPRYPHWWGPTVPWSPDDHGLNGVTKSNALVSGTYTIYMSRTMNLAGSGGGGFGDCGDLASVYLRLVHGSAVAGSSSAPPPRPVNIVGQPETDLACVPGATGTTTVQLVDFPNTRLPQPLPVGGAKQVVESQLNQVTVTQWNQADQLIVQSPDGTTVSLTPSNPTATLAAGTFWYGAVSFTPSRQADATTIWTNPQISLDHSCPSSRANSDVAVDQGYALTLGDLQGAVNTATAAAFSDLLTTSTQPDWPVYVVRVLPSSTDPAALQNYALVLELQGTGTRINASLPLIKTAFNRWSLDATGTGWAVVGTVARDPGTLTLTLSSGAVGPLQLQPTTLVLPVLP